MKKMFIVLEGPDGTGKSMLGKAITERYNVKVYHRARPTDLRELLLRTWVYPDKLPGVYDRWSPISEQVYGPIMRKKPLIGHKEMDVAIRFFDPLIIHCKPRLNYPPGLPVFDNKKPYKTVEHVSQVREHYVEIVEGYEEVMKRLRDSGLEVIDYEYGSPSLFEDGCSLRKKLTAYFRKIVASTGVDITRGKRL